MTVAVSGPTVRIKHGSLSEDLQSRIRNYNPKTDLGALVKRIAKSLPREDALALLDGIQRVVIVESELVVRVFRASPITGKAWPMRLVGAGLQPVPYEWLAQYGYEQLLYARHEDYGVVSRKVITNAGIDFLVDAFQNTKELENFTYHGLGTGTTAEAATQTALTTELTTQYNPNSTRATGTHSEVAGTPTQWRNTGTNTLDGAATIEEHAVFDQAATGGGTMWDRSLTGTQTLSANDSLQSQYTLTANAGG